MLKRILVVAVLVLGASMNASAAGVRTTVFLSGQVAGSPDPLYLNQISETEFELTTGRVMPLTLTVQSIVDKRPVDGSLTVTFNNGYQLVVTSGQTGVVHYLLVKNGNQTEMTPHFSLKAITAKCTPAAVYDASTDTCSYPSSIIAVPDQSTSTGTSTISDWNQSR